MKYKKFKRTKKKKKERNDEVNLEEEDVSRNIRCVAIEKKRNTKREKKERWA